MIRIIFVSLIFIAAVNLLASASVFEHEQNLNYISKQLPELQNITCKFRQEKFIPASSITLKSSGDFKFEKEKGVTFYTTYPIKSTVSYTSGEYKQINNIITAISNKSYSKLEQDFKFYFQKNNAYWTLGLAPKTSSPTHKYLKYIQIEGNNDISKIVITTSDNVKTTIHFDKRL